MHFGDQVVWKLGQKVREEDTSPEMVNLMNIYLGEHEYAVFAGLNASTLSKTRWRWDCSSRTIAVDAFRGVLAGLILAEVELRVGDERLGAPPSALADVTDDDRYPGGALAALDG
jgi:CYTH domain-containing protein